MGQTDLAVRMLADLLQAQLVPALLAPERVQVLHTEQTELKIIERQTDKVVCALIDDVKTMVHVEFQASHGSDVPTRVLRLPRDAAPAVRSDAGALGGGRT